ncbi:MAG: hypothetical protein JNK74_15930 [Candidatus Hydrogenedentes bacterium]|nr:hypothetical protein [Candidatus Hydrogenedentota bacterium]
MVALRNSLWILLLFSARMSFGEQINNRDARACYFEAELHSTVYGKRIIEGVAYAGQDGLTRICNYWMEPSGQYIQMTDALAYCDILMEEKSIQIWLHHEPPPAEASSDRMIRRLDVDTRYIAPSRPDAWAFSDQLRLCFLGLDFGGRDRDALPHGWPSSLLASEKWEKSASLKVSPIWDHSFFNPTGGNHERPAVLVERYPPFGRIINPTEASSNMTIYTMTRLLDRLPLVKVKITLVLPERKALGEAFSSESLGNWVAVPIEYRKYWNCLSRYRSLCADPDSDDPLSLFVDLQALGDNIEEWRVKGASAQLTMFVACLTKDSDLVAEAVTAYAEVFASFAEREDSVLFSIAELDTELSKMGLEPPALKEFYARAAQTLYKLDYFENREFAINCIQTLRRSGKIFFAEELARLPLAGASDSAMRHSADKMSQGEASVAATEGGSATGRLDASFESVKPIEIQRFIDLLDGAIKRACAEGDGSHLAANVVASNVTRALGSAPGNSYGEAIAVATHDFIHRTGCTATVSNSRLLDDLSWLIVLISHDPSRKDDHVRLQQQLEELMGKWLQDFCKSQATELEINEVELNSYLETICRNQIEDTIPRHVDSPLYPMLKLPLNDFELKKVRSALWKPNLILRQMRENEKLSDARGEREDGARIANRTKAVWMDDLLPKEVKRKCQMLLFEVVSVRLQSEPLDVGVTFDSSGEIAIGPIGPSFPNDETQAKEIARQMCSWYQATPK